MTSLQIINIINETYKSDEQPYVMVLDSFVSEVIMSQARKNEKDKNKQKNNNLSELQYYGLVDEMMEMNWNGQC